MVEQSQNNQLIIEASVKLNTLLTAAGYPTDPRKQREVFGCLHTGCEPNTEKSGPDCHYYENGVRYPAERKSTTKPRPCGAYTGISNKQTWALQIPSLEKKILGMSRHYFDRFDSETGALLESWYLTGEKAYELLLPRVKDDFDRKKAAIAAGKTPADPRLSANINWGDIKKYGTKVY